MPPGERVAPPARGGGPGKRLHADPRLRDELRLCRTYRISHSHFLGGPAAWTDTDRELAQAYEDWTNACCQQCGTHPDWWDPEKGGHRFALVADDYRCPGCEIKEQLQEQVSKEKVKGVHVRLIQNPNLAELMGEQP